MKNTLLLLVLFCFFPVNIWAQDLTVPPNILAELTSKTATTTAGERLFKIVYPTNYDPVKKYPVLLGLSGGGQSEKVVNYCYAAWFRSDYFKEYLTILPVNTTQKNLKDYTKEDILQLLTVIETNFSVTDEPWLIAGTSNGGFATFNFLSARPSRFEGAIVIPGSIGEQVVINDAWKHLKVIVAYGDEDNESWIKSAATTSGKLTPHVKSVQTIVLKGQGHILPIDFDIDVIYSAYF